ncbi:MAG: hypothetical protein VBE63_17475 [Lamprobacter sp.]|uniref:DegT/DnrJ/EryC1/StrS family aminotransferase n=1 Tax=Lamprobacter sp. TaxID=3100796 RepID=UPI002B25FCF0|nr:DegT/DnrJ/EryC1/StrS family aminotransferase [Lamprobacter sp.]MEA3641709.1 hypothetical protein [Lamprobacter sp.]
MSTTPLCAKVDIGFHALVRSLLATLQPDVPVRNCPVAEAYYERAIRLPLFPTLSESEQNQVVAVLHQQPPRRVPDLRG